MRIALKIYGIMGIVLGGSAIIDSMESGIATFIDGGMFLSWGIITMVYLKREHASRKKTNEIEYLPVDEE